MRGQNYLVPVDAEIDSEGDVDYRAIDAAWVLRNMEDVELLRSDLAQHTLRSGVLETRLFLTFQISRSGFSIVTPRIIWPSPRSSERTFTQRASSAAVTINASQKEMR